MVLEVKKLFALLRNDFPGGVVINKLHDNSLQRVFSIKFPKFNGKAIINPNHALPLGQDTISFLCTNLSLTEVLLSSAYGAPWLQHPEWQWFPVT